MAESRSGIWFQALKLRPNHPQVMNYLAYSWVDSGRNVLDESEGHAGKRQCPLRPPGWLLLLIVLGWLYYRLGDFEDAVIQLEKAISLQPSDPTINDHLGDAYWRVGRDKRGALSVANGRFGLKKTKVKNFRSWKASWKSGLSAVKSSKKSTTN